MNRKKYREQLKQARQIENFELSKSYYKNSFLNGNKTHVCEEIGELYMCDKYIAILTIAELPKEIRMYVVKSEELREAIFVEGILSLGKGSKL